MNRIGCLYSEEMNCVYSMCWVYEKWRQIEGNKDFEVEPGRVSGEFPLKGKKSEVSYINRRDFLGIVTLLTISVSLSPGCILKRKKND